MITTVIIPVLNRYDLLARCIESLPLSVQNILVIDNGDALTWSDLRSVPAEAHVRFLSMPSNLGVPQSWNLGIKLYPFEPGWLLLNSDAWMEEDAFSVLDADAAQHNIVLAGSPPWCCAWIGRDVVQRVGLFCEAFYPAYMEDIDYERRAHANDVPVLISSASVRHDNSSTIRSDTELRRKNDASHARNQAIYDNRWDGVQAHEVPAILEWDLRTRLVNSWD